MTAQGEFQQACSIAKREKGVVVEGQRLHAILIGQKRKDLRAAFRFMICREACSFFSASPIV